MPHFYVVKLGFTGVYLFLLFFNQNIHCGYSLPTMYVLGKNILKNLNFSNEFFLFFSSEKNVCILHGQVFVMYNPTGIGYDHLNSFVILDFVGMLKTKYRKNMLENL